MSVPLDPRFRHYMLQEIHEQPQTLQKGIEHYFSPAFREQTFSEFRLDREQISSIRHIRIVASGSSRFAGLYGEYVLERLGGIPVEVDYSSQYAYRDAVTAAGELTVFLTQSGTTADTLAAQREAKAKGAKTIAICNVRNAPITREADGVLYTHAGDEVAIAATKSFTAQLIALFALSLYFGDLRNAIAPARMTSLRRALAEVPDKARRALQCERLCGDIASRFKDSVAWMVLGRDISYPIALEAALKLKETSYIYAEGYPTGEVKHGPTALVDETLPVLMILTRDLDDAWSKLRYEKSLAILEELKAKGSHIIAISTEGDSQLDGACAANLAIPAIDPLLSPILETIPAQLLAYHLSVVRGRNVDRPRNLSKSVVLE